MKQITSIIAVLVFLAGLSIPSNLFAGHKGFFKAEKQNSTVVSKPAVKKDMISAPKPRPVKSLRATIGALLNKLTKSTIGITVIDIPQDESDGPLEMSEPPWLRKLDKKRRPDKDDHGWGDTNR